MCENDTILIHKLKNSFGLQLQWYKELLDLDRKMMSKLVLSRGDISVIITGTETKNSLINKVQAERSNACEMIELWQQRKTEINSNDEERVALDKIFGEIENVIGAFLREEDLLKKYIDGVLNLRAN